MFLLSWVVEFLGQKAVCKTEVCYQKAELLPFYPAETNDYWRKGVYYIDSFFVYIFFSPRVLSTFFFISSMNLKEEETLLLTEL